jgi:hypothetical protein
MQKKYNAHATILQKERKLGTPRHRRPQHTTQAIHTKKLKQEKSSTHTTPRHGLSEHKTESLHTE